MSLTAYKEKRTLKKTPEPKAKKPTKGKDTPLIFVVQKHDASHLHYDFRLELDGVLLSWAVPKGPSMDPAIKRLAVHVEDHPIEYAKFHGTIPKGNYGAGTVEIWDHGTYEAVGTEDRKESEKVLRKQLKEGKLDFILHGKKLKGAFALIELKNDPKGKNWLLIKKDDNKEYPQKKKPSLLELPKKAMPRQIKPMLATLVDKPFDGEEWIFELKWDGYRAIAEISPGNIELYSRNFISFAHSFSALIDDLRKFDNTLILDGEIIVLDENGKPSFQLMQNYMRTPGNKEAALRYCVFDLLYYQGRDLRSLPLIERKQWLQKALKSVKKKFRHIVHSDYVHHTGISFFKAAEKEKYEGIMAKDINSPYVSKRTKDWLKIKTSQQQEVVITGFTAPRASRKKFGALILAIYKNKKLTYAGHVGTGFDDKTLHDLYAKLKPLEVKECPFKTKPPTKMPVTWVKPKLICEVSFSEWTKDGIMRQPVFKGLRIDKAPKEVVEEEPEEIAPIKQPKLKDSKAAPQTLEGIITNPNKIYWPKEKYTKHDLLNYYQTIAPYMLPYLKNHPVVLNRFPDGIDGKNFFQKEAPTFIPDWIKTVSVQHAEKKISYLLINDVPSLLYAANLGSIEIHIFESTYQKIDYPDYIVLDLDPEDVPFSEVIETARELHRFLDELNIPNSCKTSGKRGLHLYIPMGAKYTFEQAADFAHLLAMRFHERMPDITSLERNPKHRQNKIYIDWLQNGRTKTVVAPYSVRPVPLATVSMPLQWSQVKKGLDPKKFTIQTVKKGLSAPLPPLKGDALKNLLRKLRQD